jgi:hypothetical protein
MWHIYFTGGGVQAEPAVCALRSYLNLYDHDPKRFVWMKTADQILASIAGFVPGRGSFDEWQGPSIARPHKSHPSDGFASYEVGERRNFWRIDCIRRGLFRCRRRSRAAMY